MTEIPGPACYCGRHGCLERWVSGWAFARDYQRHAGVDLPEAPLLTAPQVMERVRAGDRLAGLVWGRYLDRVARGLALVVNTLDPDVIVMGGGMSNVPELYDELPARAGRATSSARASTPRSCKARHGDSSGVRGAAWLWREGDGDDDESRLEFGHEVIAEAGAMALEYFGRVSTLQVNRKDAKDLVTEADVAVEKLIRARLEEAFPEDAFSRRGDRIEPTAGAPGIWVVDPIDGTQPFVSGLRTWCVSIAYLAEGRVQFGLVFNPAAGELFAGGAGRPADAQRRADRPASRGRTSPTGWSSWAASSRSSAEQVVPVLDRLLRAGGMYVRNGSGALGSVRRRLRPADRVRRAAHQLLGLPRRDRGAGVGRLPGVTTSSPTTGCSPGNPIVAGPPQLYDELVWLLHG